MASAPIIAEKTPTFHFRTADERAGCGADHGVIEMMGVVSPGFVAPLEPVALLVRNKLGESLHYVPWDPEAIELCVCLGLICLRLSMRTNSSSFLGET